VQKWPSLPLLFTFIFLLALAIPALAEGGTRFSHKADYLIDGMIEIDKQIGDPCTTGAAKYQTVRGYGRMTKSESLDIAPHIMAVEDTMDWTTAEDAIRNLEVTNTIDLCARPKSVAAEAYQDEDYDIEQGDVISPYHPLVVEGLLSVNSLTRQTWGNSAAPNPGHEGSYAADFIAAYGPGPREEDGIIGEFGERIFFDEDYMWWFDNDEEDGIDRGDRYVGNYFDIDQYLYTSDGETRRFISISSPFSTGLLTEEMEVIGMTEVTETFSMDNIEPGPDAITLAWYELF